MVARIERRKDEPVHCVMCDEQIAHGALFICDDFTMGRYQCQRCLWEMAGLSGRQRDWATLYIAVLREALRAPPELPRIPGL